MRRQLGQQVPVGREQLLFSAAGFGGQPHMFRLKDMGDGGDPDNRLFGLALFPVQRPVDVLRKRRLHLRVDGLTEGGVGDEIGERRLFQV